jgi:hypothetical protein
MSRKRTVEKHILSVKNVLSTTIANTTLLTGLYPGLMSNFRVCGSVFSTTSASTATHCWLLYIKRHGQTVPSLTFPSGSSNEVKNIFSDEEAVILFGYGVCYVNNAHPGTTTQRHYDVCSRTKRNLYREDILYLGCQKRAGAGGIYMGVQFFVEY